MGYLGTCYTCADTREPHELRPRAIFRGSGVPNRLKIPLKSVQPRIRDPDPGSRCLTPKMDPILGVYIPAHIYTHTEYKDILGQPVTPSTRTDLKDPKMGPFWGPLGVS